MTHARGKFRLTRRDDDELAATFDHLGVRTSYERCRSILVSEEADSVQGNQVYRAAYPMFDYCESVYRGIKAISSIANEAVGRVIARADPDITDRIGLYDAAVMDSIMQNAAILVDIFLRPSQDQVFVCVGIERIITSGTFDIHAGEWLVHSVMTLNTDHLVLCDSYVFDERSKKVVLRFLGFDFKRTAVQT